MRKLLLILLFTMLFVAACDQGGDDDGVSQVDVPGLETVDIEPDGLETPAEVVELPDRIILAEGSLVAVNPELALSFEANGRLVTLNVTPGDEIAAGDVVATLDDTALQDGVTSANLQLAQSENGLAQAQLSLDNLVEWEPDETTIAVAEANLVAAEAALSQLQDSEANSGNNLTAANVQINQAQRFLADVQKAYDQAHDPARDWELNDPWRAEALKAEREGTARSLTEAQEQLAVAYANYNLAAAGLNNESAVANAEATIASAQQALDSALTGPKESEIAAAQLQVDQAALAVEQSQFALQQAEDALSKAVLVAPVGGTVLTVSASVGATIGAGSPILTLLNTDALEFHTSNLSERDLAQISIGQTAEISLRAYAEVLLTGRVTRVVPTSSGLLGDAAVFTVVVTLDATELTLLPGMTGRIEIVGEE